MTLSPYGGQTRKIIILAEAQNWRCAYCPTVMLYPGQKSDPHHDDAPTVDHVIAKGSGGHTGWDNEVAACAMCNSTRGHYSALLFWLLMQRTGYDRRKVRNWMGSMTKRARMQLRKRMAKAMTQPGQIDETIMLPPQCLSPTSAAPSANG